MIDINIKADKSLHLKLCPKRFEKNFKPVENIADVLHDSFTLRLKNRTSQLVLSMRFIRYLFLCEPKMM